MSSTIAASFTGCLHVYEQLIILHTNTNAPLHGQIQLSALQDELGRFKVWAGYAMEPLLLIVSASFLTSL